MTAQSGKDRKIAFPHVREVIIYRTNFHAEYDYEMFLCKRISKIHSQSIFNLLISQNKNT